MFACLIFQISIGNTLEIVDRFNRRPLGSPIFRYDATSREFTITDYARTVQGSGYYWSLPRQFLGNKVRIGFDLFFASIWKENSVNLRYNHIKMNAKCTVRLAHKKTTKNKNLAYYLNLA